MGDICTLPWSRSKTSSIALILILHGYLKHIKPIRDFPIFERFPVLICVAIIWIYSLILTASGAYRGRPNATQISCRMDRANLISTALWFKFPYPLQWGPPTFAAGHSFAMMSAVLVSMVESTDVTLYMYFHLLFSCFKWIFRCRIS